MPGGTYAQVLTILAAFNGLFVVTLAITYQMNVVSAVVLQRSLAGRVQVLGATGREVIDRWHGVEGGPDLLQGLLSTMAGEVVELTQHHIAYPVLHRFADTEAARSAPVAVAVLDDALELLAAQRPGGAATASEQLLARSIDTYVEALAPAERGPAHPRPGAGWARRAGLERMLAEARQEWPSSTH